MGIYSGTHLSTDTWIYAVPKQSLKRPMALQRYVHQNNLVTDLWLYYNVYLAPKQSRNRPMITREYTHQCQNNLVTDLRLTELVDKIQDTYKYRSTLLFTSHNNNKKYTKYTRNQIQICHNRYPVFNWCWKYQLNSVQFRSGTTDLRFLTVRTSGRVFVVWIV